MPNESSVFVCCIHLFRNGELLLFLSPQSVIARGLLNDIAEKCSYVPVFMNFSAQTSSARSQEMIESKLEKKRKNILGN